ncbi:hypothetical protein COOONC_15168 [Cooperia oncophora]
MSIGPNMNMNVNNRAPFQPTMEQKQLLLLHEYKLCKFQQEDSIVSANINQAWGQGTVRDQSELLSNDDVRLLIIHEYLRDVSAAAATRRIKQAWGPGTVSESTVAQRFRQFEEGNYS